MNSRKPSINPKNAQLNSNFLAENRRSVEITYKLCQELLASLEEASLKFRTSEEPKTQRGAWTKALMSINFFLERLPNNRQQKHGRILNLLRDDLMELNYGLQPERLTKIEYTKATRRSSKRKIINNAIALAAIDLLVEVGYERKIATKRVAECAKKQGVILPGPQQLRNWRKDNLQRKANIGAGKWMYDSYCDYLHSVMENHELSGEQAADLVIERHLY